jgi:glycerol-1-phosphate dehydrogenase [NAD(P)+]
MIEDRIQTALRDANDTDSVVIGAGVTDSVAEVFAKGFGDQTAIVVADENTFRAAGKEVQERLEDAGQDLHQPYLFPGKPVLHADYEHIQTLIAALGQHDAIPIAVGSGTLNDIVKRAAYECDRRYMNVSTAASVDGYTAFGASITKEGYKQTMTCPAPRAVIADLGILTKAPQDMTASGYADLLGKVTAGADWIISDELGVEPIEAKVWSLVQDPLREWTAKPAELHAGDKEAMHYLIEGLIISGLAMQAHSSSRPASGAEHQFSHLWEMEGLGYDDDPPLSHGFKVGLGSISIAALYERVLARDLSAVDIDAVCAAWPSWDEIERRVRATHKTPGLDEAAVAETREKYLDADALRDQLQLLAERWPRMRKRLEQQLMPADQLRDLLLQAGCPTSPAEIDLDMQRFRDTYSRAQMIRRRYTVLDLAHQTGILEECVDELFAPGGFWAQPTAPAA